MKIIRICVYDKEEEYAKNLSAMLNRYGKGKYRVHAFNDVTILNEQMDRTEYDIFVGYAKGILRDEIRNSILILNLIEKSETEVDAKNGQTQELTISKYVGAKMICQKVEQLVGFLQQKKQTKRPVIAIYSPIGRCGKTQFALSLTTKESGNRWLYVGLEDYGVVINENKNGYVKEDTFLYYVKEHNQEKILEWIVDGIIPSVFSPFDGKLIELNDLQWLTQILQKQSIYGGTVFDIGTGVLRDASWLTVFDCVVVPYLSDEISLRKKEKFQELLTVKNLDVVKDKILFINMNKTEEIEEQRMMLQNGTKNW